MEAIGSFWYSLHGSGVLFERSFSVGVRVDLLAGGWSIGEIEGRSRAQARPGRSQEDGLVHDTETIREANVSNEARLSINRPCSRCAAP